MYQPLRVVPHAVSTWRQARQSIHGRRECGHRGLPHHLPSRATPRSSYAAPRPVPHGLVHVWVTECGCPVHRYAPALGPSVCEPVAAHCVPHSTLLVSCTAVEYSCTAMLPPCGKGGHFFSRWAASQIHKFSFVAQQQPYARQPACSQPACALRLAHNPSCSCGFRGHGRRARQTRVRAQTCNTHDDDQGF